MIKVKSALLVIALGPLTLTTLSAHAQANTKDNGISGDWKGTCTKISTGSTWDVEITIRDDDTFSWTSRFPATNGYPKGWTAGATGRVDRTSRQLIENEPYKGRVDHYSLDGRRMHVDTSNGMARCSLTR